jgi:hypothetical protein
MEQSNITLENYLCGLNLSDLHSTLLKLAIIFKLDESKLKEFVELQPKSKKSISEKIETDGSKPDEVKKAEYQINKTVDTNLCATREIEDKTKFDKSKSDKSESEKTELEKSRSDEVKKGSKSQIDETKDIPLGITSEIKDKMKAGKSEFDESEFDESESAKSRSIENDVYLQLLKLVKRNCDHNNNNVPDVAKKSLPFDINKPNAILELLKYHITNIANLFSEMSNSSTMIIFLGKYAEDLIHKNKLLCENKENILHIFDSFSKILTVTKKEKQIQDQLKNITKDLEIFILSYLEQLNEILAYAFKIIDDSEIDVPCMKNAIKPYLTLIKTKKEETNNIIEKMRKINITIKTLKSADK